MSLLQATVWIVWWTAIALAGSGSYLLVRLKWSALSAWWIRYNQTRKRGRVIHVVTPLGKIQQRRLAQRDKWQDPKPDYLKSEQSD